MAPGSAYNVAGTHLSGDSGGQRLKRTHAAVMLLAVQRQVAEHLPHSLAEAADLDKPGLDAVPQAHGHQQKYQNVVGQVRVDAAYRGIQRSVQFCDDCFHSFLLLYRLLCAKPCCDIIKRSGLDNAAAPQNAVQGIQQLRSQGRNPQPVGEKVLFPACRCVKITLSFHLRDSADTPPFTFGTRLTGILQSRIHL